MTNNENKRIDVQWSSTWKIDESAINRFVDIIVRRLLYWAMMMGLCLIAVRAAVGFFFP